MGEKVRAEMRGGKKSRKKRKSVAKKAKKTPAWVQREVKRIEKLKARTESGKRQETEAVPNILRVYSVQIFTPRTVPKRVVE